MNRETRARKAQETLDIFRAGFYMRGGGRIDCRSRFATDFVTEAQLNNIKLTPGNLVPRYETVNESVVDVILRIGNCGVLNFASARNPGGGFLNGSVAQEESLAVSSDLFNSLLEAPPFYETNKHSGSALYTHNMIYSRDILFIRNGSMELIQQPVFANILTAPAVNAGAYLKNEVGTSKTVDAVMKKRIRYILRLFATKGDREIVLGAYGCGVFRNDPHRIAGLFHSLLKDEQLERNFERIVFAVYDTRGDQYSIFKNRFAYN